MNAASVCHFICKRQTPSTLSTCALSVGCRLQKRWKCKSAYIYFGTVYPSLALMVAYEVLQMADITVDSTVQRAINRPVHSVNQH